MCIFLLQMMKIRVVFFASITYFNLFPYSATWGNISHSFWTHVRASKTVLWRTSFLGIA